MRAFRLPIDPGLSRPCRVRSPGSEAAAAKGEPPRLARLVRPDRAERTVRADVSRVAAAYAVARGPDLLAIMVGTAIFVLLLAAVAGVGRG
jgi:hypothetical protein